LNLADHDELLRLRKENERLRMEREILKKATFCAGDAAQQCGVAIIGVIWGMALLGIILDLMPKQGNRVLPVIIYLTMGWLMVVAIKQLLQVLPMAGFYSLLCGGIFYTVGVVFYLHDEIVSYFHGIWHILLLLGSFSHYFTILNFVA
jgi:hemolysin III